LRCHCKHFSIRKGLKTLETKAVFVVTKSTILSRSCEAIMNERWSITQIACRHRDNGAFFYHAEMATPSK
jgi:hypothetical protein